MNYKNDKGSVSPFLIIVMTALILLIFGLADLFRIKESKNHLHTMGMIAINSCMCDYNLELKKDYDLFAFVYQTKFEIEDEISKNIKNNLNGFGINKIELLETEIIDSINLENKNEIIRQIKDNYFENSTLDLLDEFFYDEDTVEKISNEQINVCTEDEYENISSYLAYDNRDDIKNKIEKTYNDDILISNEILDEVEINHIIFEESKNESKKIINKIKNKLNFMNNQFLDEYIFDKFDFLNKEITNNKEKIFDAEIEFILCGSNSQNENIRGVKNKIIMIFYPEKLIEVYNDQEKKMNAEIIAQAVCGWWATEIGVAITKNALLSAWAADLANDEYEKLIQGETVHLKLLNKDITYKDMLNILLLIQNEDEKIDNMIKLINLNMKKYNYNFSMKTSFSQIKVKLKAKEKFLFMTRYAIPNEFRFTNEVNINEEISYGY